jgi:predicted TIM-barrel fold metal-dependent hydrolase
VRTSDRVRAFNERMGDLVDAYPDSLRAYAFVDPFGGDRMLSQAFELVHEWRFVGLIVNSSVHGEYLSSPRASGFFEMAAEAGVPVLLHPPADPVGARSARHLGMVEHVTRYCDVTMGTAEIVCAGVLDRFPTLRLIAVAGGGGLAFLPEKLEMAMAMRGDAADSAGTAAHPSRSLRRVYVDTSCLSEVQLRANLQVFGSRNVLFGTDAPPLVSQVERIAEMVRNLPISAEDRSRIDTGNAVELFGFSMQAAGGAL